MTRTSVAVLLACLAGSVATHAGRAPQAWTLARLMTPAELQATGLSGSEVDPICSWVYHYAWEIFGVARGESADGELSKTWTRPFEREQINDTPDDNKAFEEQYLSSLPEANRRAFFDWLEAFVRKVAREARLPQDAAAGDRTIRAVRQAGWSITLEDGSTWEVLSWYRSVTVNWKPGVQVSLEESPIAFGEFHQRLVAPDGVRALVRPEGPVEGSPPAPAGETPH